MMRHAAAIVIVLVFNAASLHAQDTTFTVRHETADVYKGPSTGAAIIGHVRQGAVLQVTRELGSWVKISWPDAPDGVGYVHVTMGTIGHGGAMTEHPSSTPSMPPSSAPAARRIPAPSPNATENSSPSERLPQPVPLQPVFVTPMTHMVGIGGRIAGASTRSPRWAASLPGPIASACTGIGTPSGNSSASYSLRFAASMSVVYARSSRRWTASSPAGS